MSTTTTKTNKRSKAPPPSVQKESKEDEFQMIDIDQEIKIEQEENNKKQKTKETETTFQPLSTSFQSETNTTTIVPYVAPVPRLVDVNTKIMVQVSQSISFEFTNKTAWGENFKKLITATSKKYDAVPKNQQMMLFDINKNDYHYFWFYPPSGLSYEDTSFDTFSYGKIPQFGIKCPKLSSAKDLVFTSPICRLYFAELAPLGNYDPQSADFGEASLAKANNQLNLKLQPSPSHPEFDTFLILFDKWLIETRIRGLEAMMYNPESKAYQMLKASGLNPTGTEEEKIIYEAEFWDHCAPLYKDDKDGKYPKTIDASTKAFKVCSYDQAVAFEGDDENKIDPVLFIPPGNLNVIKNHFETSSRKEEPTPKYPKGIRRYMIPHDVPIFDADGNFIIMNERPEVKAYSDVRQRDFIHRRNRSSIQNGEWGYIKFGISFTYKAPDEKKKIPWSIQMRLDLVSVHKHLPADVSEHYVCPYDRKDVTDPDKLPKGIPSWTHEQEKAFLEQAKIDDALLGFDLDAIVRTQNQPAITGSSSSTNGSSSSTH